MKSEIVRYEPSPDLTPVERCALEKWSCVKIKERNKASMGDQLTDSVCMAYINIGQFSQSEDKKLVSVLVEQLVHELKECFTTYTLEEVCYAIELGSKGKLNNLEDVIQPIVSVMNVLKWVTLYNDKVRKEAIHKQNAHIDHMEKAAEALQHKQKEQAFIEEIINVFDGFPQSFIGRSKGELAAHYRQLSSMGIITFTEDFKWGIYRKILEIKDRTRFWQKSFIEITAKELSEYRALRLFYRSYKEMDMSLYEGIHGVKKTEDKRK